MDPARIKLMIPQGNRNACAIAAVMLHETYAVYIPRSWQRAIGNCRCMCKRPQKSRFPAFFSELARGAKIERFTLQTFYRRSVASLLSYSYRSDLSCVSVLRFDALLLLLLLPLPSVCDCYLGRW